MSEKEKQLLYSYIMNNRIRMEEEIQQLQNNIRFRRISVADCVELICAIQRYETFVETSNHFLALMKLYNTGEKND